MKTISLNWNDFKILSAAKNLGIQYSETATTYEVFAVEATIEWESNLLKGSSDSDDFESNYKSNANKPLEYRSTDGLPKFAPAKFVETLDLYVDGENGLVSLASEETKYSRTHYSVPYTLAGADVKWETSNYGDYIDFEVGVYTDINDEGTFISLNKFGNKYRIMGSGGRLFDVPTVKVVPPTVTIGENTLDVYIRAKCVNVGNSASKILINLVGWK